MDDPQAPLLKLAPDATLAQIKAAWRKAALAHHPDLNPHPHAARHFRRLNETYKALEAKALLREPPRPRPEIALAERLGFVLSDVKALLKRWSPERWHQRVDGLPALVWVASALEVLARSWPGAPMPSPIPPTLAGITDAVEGWSERLAGWPLGRNQPSEAARKLAAAIQAAEVRLRALDRPRRGPH